MKIPSSGFVANTGEGEKKKMINSELWHACAGPLVSLPPAGSLVVYFPQGHSEQVAASMHKKIDDIPSYPNLPSKLICMLHNVTLHADTETDEVYAQMTLQPVSKYDQEALLVSDMGLKQNRQPSEFFCKTLTASDTSTHGGFSVPRRAAEKIFPPLDFSMQPPAQEISARDLHDQTWTFRHIYRGQPKRHLLTTGWSIFVSSKRLITGDAVLFIRNEKSQLLLGIRRANKQQPPISSSVMSSDSMHIGILAAAAHAAANSSPFTIFVNPRTSPSEFVIPLAKYNKAMYTQVSLGMRFRMMFETEESGVRRYVGTVTGTSDLDPVRWKSSQWRNLQIGWDESTDGERPSRVSIWEIEPVVTPFYICPPPFFRPKFPKLPGFAGDDSNIENMFKRGMPWIADDSFGLKDASSSIFPGLSLDQWMSMQQNQSGLFSNVASDDHSKLLNFQSPALSTPNHQNRQMGQLQQSTVSWPQQQQQQMLQSQTTQQQQQFIHQTQQQVQQQLQRVLQNPHQQILLPPVTCDQTAQQNSQQTAANSQFRHQNELSTNKNAFSLTPDLLFQQRSQPQHINLLQQAPLNLPQQSLTNGLQRQQQSLQEQKLQLQFLQKLQQQQQMMSSSQTPGFETPFSQKQQTHESQQMQNSNGMLQSQQFPLNQFQGQQKTPLPVRPHSFTDGLSSSISPSKNNFHVSQPNFFKNPTGQTALTNGSTTVHHAPNFAQEIRGNLDVGMKNELPNSIAQQPKFKGNTIDQLDVSSSATSYCLDGGGIQQNFPITGLDNDVQSHTRGNIPFVASGVDGLATDALLSSGYDAGKDIHNLLSNYSDAPRDMEMDMSSAINSQSFEVPPFKPGCSNDVVVNDTAVLNGGLWPNQTQRIRTYTKVQKRGSVGRTIDVTRYKGYDELRNDLARMFGIEGLLEDPQRTDQWKLVYVDHENDILLVGDDPWEEFLSCVQSIKILSSAEVQQMSLDGDLSQIPVSNQACSGTESGNAWRGQYDDNSAASFNR